MSVATGSSEAAGGARGGGARVFFQSPRGGSPGSGSGSGSSREDAAPVAPAAAAGQVQQQQQQQQRRHQQGKVTVKYDRKELRKRLVLEEWIVEQLGQLYGCQVPGRGRGLPPPGCPPGILRGCSPRARTVLTPGDPAPPVPGRLLAAGSSEWVASACVEPRAPWRLQVMVWAEVLRSVMRFSSPGGF